MLVLNQLMSAVKLIIKLNYEGITSAPPPLDYPHSDHPWHWPPTWHWPWKLRYWNDGLFLNFDTAYLCSSGLFMQSNFGLHLQRMCADFHILVHAYINRTPSILKKHKRAVKRLVYPLLKPLRQNGMKRWWKVCFWLWEISIKLRLWGWHPT